MDSETPASFRLSEREGGRDRPTALSGPDNAAKRRGRRKTLDEWPVTKHHHSPKGKRLAGWHFPLLSFFHPVGLFRTLDLLLLFIFLSALDEWMVPAQDHHQLRHAAAAAAAAWLSRLASCERLCSTPPPSAGGKRFIRLIYSFIVHFTTTTLNHLRGHMQLHGGQTSWGETYLGVGRGRRVLEDRVVHEDGAVVAVKVVQQRCERLVQANVAADVAVAGRLRGHAQGHPALRGVADRALLAAHAVAAAAQASRADDQGQFQHQLLAPGDVDVDLWGRNEGEMTQEFLKSDDSAPKRSHIVALLCFWREASPFFLYENLCWNCANFSNVRLVMTSILSRYMYFFGLQLKCSSITVFPDYKLHFFS